ncbi:MAG: hypothetical protein KDD35_03470, partial [Bdellovibrionales bacterium]|nr:hypothetical protein [Bdellovibrionales bacterium]
MRPKQPNHIAHFLALAVMAVMALTMPACQKARMQKKDGQPREVRVQPDQDSGRSADPAVIPQNPLQAYNRYIGQRQPPQGTPTGSQGNG